ncbi:MAG TPA: hypothetical protein VN843_05045 [Anaerolineales bacterium]|nr:hypothetical protein [Anaerolineales bacterium]
MAEKIYFQWQNPILRKTIYRRRELKLRHFLLYYKEIDLWAENKNKKIGDLSKEKAEFEKDQKSAIFDAYNTEQKWRKYFDDSTQPSVSPTNSQAGKEEMAHLEKLLFGLYSDFTVNFAKYAKEPDESRDRKEKNFVAMCVTNWEGHCKVLSQKVAKKKDKPKELEDLKTVLSTMEAELGKLKEFAAAQAKLEKRKAEFAKRLKENSEKQADILKDLVPLEKQIEAGEAEREKLKAAIARLTSPPKLSDILNYFSPEGDIYSRISHRFGEGEWKVDKTIVDAVIDAVQDAFGDMTSSFRKEILAYMEQWLKRENKDSAWLSQQIKYQLDKIQKAQKKLAKGIDALEDGAKSMRAASKPKDSQEAEWLANLLGARQETINILSGAGMREILESELNKLEDLQVAIEYLGQKDKTKWDEEKIQPQRSALEKCENEILKAKNKIQKDGLKEKLAPITSVLEIEREKYLSEYVPDQPENVKGESLKKQEEKLKKEIVLYLAEKENARLEKLDHDELLNEVFQRFWKEPKRFPLWLQYMVIHFSGMRYASSHDSWYDPRALLLDLWTMDVQEGLKNNDDDPSNDTDYEIDDLTDEQVLEKLKTYKSQLPPWMWKEIVEVTDLRLTEVTKEDEDWENLSPEEQEKRNSNQDKKTGKYRQIMEKWKKNISGWREEHNRANRLVVTRAVCNEVAEHIQHLRGHDGAAGLTEKPGWYMGAESKYYESKERKAGPRPYFVKAKSRNDFEVGASILWLRFVNEVPNQWRVAKPLETRAGDGLLPGAYLGRTLESGNWVYKLGEPVMRARFKNSTNNTNKKKGPSKGPKENQWLRWMHEATVVEVAETAETGENNKVVLTFETALPDEDRSAATIGLFKRYLSDLTREQVEDSYNAAFVGFMPEKEIPASDQEGLKGLEEMLDWNHILQKEVIPAAELEAYRKNYIRTWKPSKPTIQIIDTVEREKGKADLPICDFVKWTDSLVTPNNNLWKVRIWGDKKLPGLTVKSASVKEKADSNFQAVGVYVKEIRQRGAVSNFLTIGRKDIDKLIAMQIEDEFERKRSDRKRLEVWREQKMNWLCKGEGTIYFTKGGKGWETAQSILWGTVALGGNLVQVEGDPEPIVFKVEGGKKKEIMMAKLVGFSPSDWYKPLDELLAQGLVHRCFCAYTGDKPGDSPQGIVYSPFFSPRYWDFSGTARPSAFYLPFDQLIKPGDEDYVGIRQRLKCKDEE